MKRTEPKRFSQIFDDAMAIAGQTDSMAMHRACYLWPEIVGPGVNRYTFRRFVDTSTGILHIHLTSAPLRQELSFHRTRLVRLLNEAVGSDAITDIIFH